MVRAKTIGMLALLLFVSADGIASSASLPDGYKKVWSDEFKSLSLRTSGPTYAGLESGYGIWSSPGAWYSSDPRGVAGYGGYDWFIDPSYYGWPSDYHGQLTITQQGLRIRSEPPIQQIARLLPLVKGSAADGGEGVRHGGVVPWLSSQISSAHAVRIKPPFYFEARAKMPRGVGRPFSAIWLSTDVPPNTNGRNYEIDVQEGFGDSDVLHSAIHWGNAAKQYPFLPIANVTPGIDLSDGFNTWGCKVTKEQQIVYFNGVEVGRVATPVDGPVDQYFGIILDVSAGMPWSGGGPPSDGPHDMIIQYVRFYAPNEDGLILNHIAERKK